MPLQSHFEEGQLLGTAIRDLRLTIEGTAIEPVLHEFRVELERAGIRRLEPHFYLSDEWGVPFETIAIGIPFYLVRADLLAMHEDRVGFVEGLGRIDLLRYLRHEMGHVVNYAYRLYEQEDWIRVFGAITQPYLEEYHPEPFSRRFVHHLPGWYAQKHPDEDWAETFAVWLTPGEHWRTDYAASPHALAKLEFCDDTMASLASRDPIVTATQRDDDVSQLTHSLGRHYDDAADDDEPLSGLDGAFRAICEDFGAPERAGGAPTGASDVTLLPVRDLILQLERDLVAQVFRWTAHFPEPTRVLVRHLAQLAEELNACYPAERRSALTVAITALVTTLAMNHVIRGSYFP